ncbi:MAG: hypothetical protein EBT07_11200 [Actinobacteria bacterium]|nr:hypothetical protein [Actinomycetota bacterium]
MAKGEPFNLSEIEAGILSRYPQYMNPLLPTYYRFSIAKLPKVSYFCQSVSLPTVTMSEVIMPTPFQQISRPSKLDFDELNLGFVIDENMGNYLEIFNWLRSMTNVEDYQEFKPSNTHVTTANLVILNSSKNPKLNVTFHDIYPRILSSVDFSSTVIDPEPFIANCTFKYRSFDIQVL